MRLNEVAIHHVALDIGFGLPDVPVTVTELLIQRYSRRYANQGVAIDDIKGPLADRLGWLAGRGDGSSLHAPGGASLPTIPNLG